MCVREKLNAQGGVLDLFDFNRMLKRKGFVPQSEILDVTTIDLFLDVQTKLDVANQNLQQNLQSLCFGLFKSSANKVPKK